jgi:Zn-finger nucleic acid-binding protein
MTASCDDTVRFAHCSRCGGEWVCQDGLQLVVEAETPRVVPSAGPSVQALHPADLAVRYRGCPSCGERMNRRQFMAGSGVIIDECRGHGVWLDSQERERILEFVRSGAAVRRQLQMAEEVKSTRPAAGRDEVVPVATGIGGGWAMGPLPDPLDIRDAADLAGLGLRAVAYVIRHLWD